MIDQLVEMTREIRSVQELLELDSRTLEAGRRLGLWESASFSPGGRILASPPRQDAVLEIIQGALDCARERLQHRAEARRLRGLLDNIPDMVWLKSKDGAYLECNRAFQGFLGASLEQILGKTDYDFVPAELAEFFRHNDQRVLEAGSPIRNEEWVTFPDGHRELLETLKAPFVEHGQVLGVLGIARNYTEYWSARRQLAESEQRLRMFLEHSPAAVAMFDRDMNYLLVSYRFAVDYRLPYSDLVGRNHWEVFPDLPERWHEVHRRCLAGAIESCEEDCFPRADGTLDWVRWEIRPWYSADGEVGGVILFSEIITAAKVAERALRESEELLRTMFEAAPIGMALMDTACLSMLSVNPALCNLTGYSQQELLEGQGQLWSLLRQDTQGVEVQYRRRDGSLAWVEVRHCQLAEAEQSVLLVQDINQRRQLEENRRLQTSALQAAAQGIVITDSRGRIEWANQAFNQHTGYSQREVLGQPIGMLKSGHHDENFYARLWQTLSQGHVWQGEIINRHKDGHLLFIEETITPVVGEDGQTSHYIAIQQDIGERRRVQEALAHSEEQYRGLVESLDDLIISSDREGLITFANRAVESFHWASTELLGKPLTDFLDGQVAGLTVGDQELRLLDGQGKTRTLLCRVRREQSGGLIMICTDLTRQRDTEEQLRAAQRMEAVGRLAGGVAHDFNNILTVILSYSELAQSEVPEDDPLYGDIAEIHAAGKRAAALTRQLLTFSRRQVMQLETIELNQLTSGLTRMLERLIGEDVELSFFGQTDLSPIQADRGQLEQVLMNLAVNARDAMPDGGSLEVRTEYRQLDEVPAAALGVEAGAYVCLSVRDSGCGMDEDTQSRMFEPFFTTKGLGKGTGLGLSTVYGIVKQSGGGISVESNLGEGTRVDVYFPVQLCEERKEAVRELPPRPWPNGETLLIVEDESALRNVLQRVLTSAGYHVMVAANPGEALLCCEQFGQQVDLLLTDVIMPGMNGRELAERLKPLCPRAKLMFMSGYTHEALERFHLTGENFLPKPFDWQTVNLRIRAVLDS
ncbi:MAG: PAS domain S-box protein [Vulcanimicrobiota bacterium]